MMTAKPKWLQIFEVLANHFEQTVGFLLVILFIVILLILSLRSPNPVTSLLQATGAFTALLIGVARYAKSFRNSQNTKKK